MLITCKDFIFSDFRWKKIFVPGNGGEAGAPLPSFSYGPVRG